MRSGNRGLLLLSSVLFLLSLTSELTAQDEPTLAVLEEGALLRLLFDTEDYTPERGGKWTPDFEESLKFNISDDGFCYTNLDSVMMVPLFAGPEYEDLSLAVLVFTTYDHQGEGRADCHGCAPDISIALFEEVEDGWNLRSFRKHAMQFGAWGERGDLSIVSFGEGNYALNLESAYTGQGYTSGWASLISLSTYNDLDEIVSVMTYDTGPAGCEEECDAEWCQYYRNVEREMSFVPNIYADAEYPEFYNLVVTVTERSCQGTVRTYDERYLFNGLRYERMCE